MKKRTLISILLTLSTTLVILLAMGLSASAAEYDLWIAGEQVTDENKADVLGDGVFRYDSDSKYLTISGDCISGESAKPGIGFGGSAGETVIKSEISGLTIDVTEDSKLITEDAYNSFAAVELDENTRITGKGSLIIAGSGHWNAGGCDGIFSKGSLSLEDITLEVHGTNGIYGKGGTLTIQSSDVKCTGTAAGGAGYIIGGFDSITLDRCSITSPEGITVENVIDYCSSTNEMLIIQRTTHKVNSSALNVRENPDTDSNRIGGLTQDKEVIVLETQGEWSKIVYGTGFGWVQSKYLEEIKATIYNVTFDANGGSGTMPSMTVKEGEKLTLPECSFTPPEGKVFDRWIAGKPGERVDIGGDSTIRAFWKDSESSGLPNPFVDIFKSDDYYDAVLWAFHREPQITNGMDETHFGPQLTVTRGQAVTFLWRAMGCPTPVSEAHGFWDISSSEYYFEPVLWAVEQGITKGTAAHSFSPDDTLSTQHMVTFLYRTKNPGKDGWDGEAAAWAETGYGPDRPFGVSTAVNNMTPCPRCYVVQFLYSSGAKG